MNCLRKVNCLGTSYQSWKYTFVQNNTTNLYGVEILDTITGNKVSILALYKTVEFSPQLQAFIISNKRDCYGAFDYDGHPLLPCMYSLSDTKEFLINRLAS